MAEHDHALFLQESFDGKVARHVREALGSEAASLLDAPPDVELRDNGLVEVTCLQLHSCLLVNLLSQRQHNRRPDLGCLSDEV